MRPQGVHYQIINMAAWLERVTTKLLMCDWQLDRPVPHHNAGKQQKMSCAARIRNRFARRSQKSIVFKHPFPYSAQRASSEYRVHLCSILFDDVLTLACSVR
jgi:hypothetical protein